MADAASVGSDAGSIRHEGTLGSVGKPNVRVATFARTWMFSKFPHALASMAARFPTKPRVSLTQLQRNSQEFRSEVLRLQLHQSLQVHEGGNN